CVLIKKIALLLFIVAILELLTKQLSIRVKCSRAPFLIIQRRLLQYRIIILASVLIPCAWTPLKPIFILPINLCKRGKHYLFRCWIMSSLGNILISFSVLGRRDISSEERGVPPLLFSLTLGF